MYYSKSPFQKIQSPYCGSVNFPHTWQFSSIPENAAHGHNYIFDLTANPTKLAVSAYYVLIPGSDWSSQFLQFGMTNVDECLFSSHSYELTQNRRRHILLSIQNYLVLVIIIVKQNLTYQHDNQDLIIFVKKEGKFIELNMVNGGSSALMYFLELYTSFLVRLHKIRNPFLIQGSWSCFLYFKPLM